MLETSPDILGNIFPRLFGASRGAVSQPLSALQSLSQLQRVSSELGLGSFHNAKSPLELSKHLRRTMPEEHLGEHLFRSQLLTQRFDIAAPEFLRLAFYQLSNNIFDGVSCDLVRDELLLEMATSLGLEELTQTNMIEPTISSILDKVWGAALRRGRFKIVAWLLKRHFRVDRPCHCFHNWNHHWPLNVVLSPGGRCCCPNKDTTSHPPPRSDNDFLAVIQVLLAGGASPDSSCCTRHGTPMEKAIESGWLDIAQAFVEHGIRTHGQNYLLGMDFEKLFLLVPWDLDSEKQQAILGYLRSLSASTLSLLDPYYRFLTPEGLIRAAEKGCQPFLVALREMGADFNCQTSNGDFPMGAVLIGKIQQPIPRCQALIELGASVNYQPVTTTGENYQSALHLASCTSHDCLSFLLDNGANLHNSARLPTSDRWDNKDYQRLLNVKTPLSPLDSALWLQRYENASLLLESEAPVRGHEACFLFQSLLHTHYHDQNEPQEPPIHLLKALVSQGAALGLISGTDKTVLDIAVLLEYHEIASYLVQIDAPQNTNLSLDVRYVDDDIDYEWLARFHDLAKAEDFSTSSLDGWFQLHPYKTNSSHRTLLDDFSYWTWERPGLYSQRLLEYVLQKCPQEHSSTAICLVLRHLELSGLNGQLATLHNLVMRMRAEAISDEWDFSALSMLVDLASRTEVAEVMGMLGLMLERQMETGPSSPYDNPLLSLFQDSELEGEICTRFEERHFWKPVLDKFVHAGFRTSTLVGLFAVSRGCSISQLQGLIDAGFDPRKRYHWTHTTLQLAVSREDIEMVRFLLNQGVDVNGHPSWTRPEPDQHPLAEEFGPEFGWWGRSALQHASEIGHFECLELLFDRGARINAPAGRVAGGTALQLAAAKGHIGVVKWLIDQGAEVIAPGSNEFGATVIEGAAMNGRIDVVGLLLDEAKFEKGEGRDQCIRAIGYARASGHQLMASYMERRIGWSDADEEALDQESLIDFEEVWDRWEDLCDDTYCDCHGEESVDEGVDVPACWSDSSESSEGRYDSEHESTPEESTSCRISDVFNDSRDNSPRSSEMPPVSLISMDVDPGESQSSTGFGTFEEFWGTFMDIDSEENPSVAGFGTFEEFWETVVLPGMDPTMVSEGTGENEASAFKG